MVTSYLNKAKEYLKERNEVNKAVFHDKEYLRTLGFAVGSGATIGALMGNYLNSINNGKTFEYPLLIPLLSAFIGIPFALEVAMAFKVANKWEKEIKEKKELSDDL